MMNKWIAMKNAGNNKPNFGGGRSKRPRLASECSNLEDAERYRRQILREVSEKITKIQNPGLGEHAIRDLNDEINHKLREKHHWNKRIEQLGGPNFIELERKQQMEASAEGNSDSSLLMNKKSGGGGYRYFGAARDLPGVKELFQRQSQAQTKRKRGEVWKTITPDYFGWRDEEDGVLLDLEQQVESKAKADLRKKRREYKRQRLDEQQEDDDDESEQEDVPGQDDEDDEIPTQEEIAKALLEQKKKALLARLTL